MFDRSAIVRRAWEIFAREYGWRKDGRGIRFKFIGRECFAWCLAQAWRLARLGAQARPVSETERCARLASLKADLSALQMQDSFLASTNRRMHAVRSEMSQLAA